MSKTYRPGAIGALMDEYERAAAELVSIVDNLSADDLAVIRDEKTRDEDCRSIETILRHVVRSGYGYADYIRTAWSVPSSKPEHIEIPVGEIQSRVRSMLDYTVATLDGKWTMPDDEITAVKMTVRWGPTYDLEQLLEHAIVHVLRHRRQIERFLAAAAV